MAKHLGHCDEPWINFMCLLKLKLKEKLLLQIGQLIFRPSWRSMWRRRPSCVSYPRSHSVQVKGIKEPWLRDKCILKWDWGNSCMQCGQVIVLDDIRSHSTLWWLCADTSWLRVDFAEKLCPENSEMSCPEWWCLLWNTPEIKNMLHFNHPPLSCNGTDFRECKNKVIQYRRFQKWKLDKGLLRNISAL